MCRRGGTCALWWRRPKDNFWESSLSSHRRGLETELWSSSLAAKITFAAESSHSFLCKILFRGNVKRGRPVERWEWICSQLPKPRRAHSVSHHGAWCLWKRLPEQAAHMRLSHHLWLLGRVRNGYWGFFSSVFCLIPWSQDFFTKLFVFHTALLVFNIKQASHNWNKHRAIAVINTFPNFIC